MKASEPFFLVKNSTSSSLQSFTKALLLKINIVPFEDSSTQSVFSFSVRKGFFRIHEQAKTMESPECEESFLRRNTKVIESCSEKDEKCGLPSSHDSSSSLMLFTFRILILCREMEKVCFKSRRQERSERS